MDIKTQCTRYDLDAVPMFWATPEYKLHEIYNGAGPDHFNKVIRFMLKYMYPNLSTEEAEEKLRKEITEFLSLFKPGVAVHDFDFTFSDKTRKTFDIVNNRLLGNMMKIIDKKYPFKKFWMWHKRVKWRGKARLTYFACDKFGWDAWIN